LLRGEVELDDEVSRDRQAWQRAGLVPEVVPRALRAPAAGAADPEAGLPACSLPLRPLLVSALLLAGVLALGFWSGGGTPGVAPACDQAAAAAVDWRHCALAGLAAPGADLTAARMENVDLTGATLAGASLVGARLDYARLRRADLGYAVLRAASLRGADLRGADLTNADLSGADLGFADLRGATLAGALLERVRLDGTLWPDGTVCARGSVGTCVSAPPQGRGAALPGRRGPAQPSGKESVR
jgi:hypothetical protein